MSYFKSILEVQEKFYREIGNSITVGTDKPIVYPVSYAKASPRGVGGSIGYSQTGRKAYPQVVIQDFMPTKNEMYNQIKEPYYDSYLDEDGDGISESMLQWEEPYFLDFRFDVGVFAEKPSHRAKFVDYMLSKYKFESVFPWYDKETNGTYYTMAMNDSVRNDGISETNFTFTVSTWVLFNEPVRVETAVVKIKSRIKNIPLPDVSSSSEDIYTINIPSNK